MNWSAPARPVDHAEQSLVKAILDGQFPPGSTLPGERDLAELMGITRPTLREALRRLERDGWLTVQQGKSTTVNNFWHDGGMNILSGIVRYSRQLPPDFVPNLLQVRLDLAPSYTRAAIEQAADDVVACLSAFQNLDDSPQAFATFDWELQQFLTHKSGNPIYNLIMNSFADFYVELAQAYFALQEARQSSKVYYAILLKSAKQQDTNMAEKATREVMLHSVDLWQKLVGQNK